MIVSRAEDMCYGVLLLRRFDIKIGRKLGRDLRRGSAGAACEILRGKACELNTTGSSITNDLQPVRDIGLVATSFYIL